MTSFHSTAAFLTLCLVLVATGLFAEHAYGHAGATGVVKERMDRMSAVSNATKLIGNMLRGRADYDSAKLAAAAEAIANNSASDFLALFEEGSFDHPSEALPVILEKADAFAKILKELEDAATQVAMAADKGAEAVQPHFRAMTATCKTCHQTFRMAR